MRYAPYLGTESLTKVFKKFKGKINIEVFNLKINSKNNLTCGTTQNGKRERIIKLWDMRRLHE